MSPLNWKLTWGRLLKPLSQVSGERVKVKMMRKQEGVGRGKGREKVGRRKRYREGGEGEIKKGEEEVERGSEYRDQGGGLGLSADLPTYDLPG